MALRRGWKRMPKAAPFFEEQSMIHASISQKWLPLFGIAAIAAVGGLAIGWRSQAPVQSPHAATEQSIQPTPSEQERVQHAIAEVRRVQPEGQAVAAAQMAAMSPQEMIEKGNEATRRRVAELDSWYYSMPANSQWANSNKADIDSLVNVDIPQVSHLTPQAYKSNCRNHVCRMEASLSGATADDWVDIVNAGLSRSLPRTHMLMLHNGDGSTTVVMYAMASSIKPRI